MIPIRVLLVEEALPFLRNLREDLEELGDFEVFAASSSAAGMLSLARLQPDVLLLNPTAGRGSPEEWRRAVERYRRTRSLGVIVLAGPIPSRDREILLELADLGLVERPVTPRQIQQILSDWAGQETPVRRAG